MAIISEDWRQRMLVVPKGDFGSGAPGAVNVPGRGRLGTGPNPASDGNIPYNNNGAQTAMAWDPAKDDAEGNQCKAYGAAGIMRQPTHLRISWQDDNTLKLETDYGTQTRLFHFAPPQGGQAVSGILSDAAKSASGAQQSWQGFSTATWTVLGGGMSNFQRGGYLKVVTTQMKAGYYYKNGMPYSDKAVLTEHYRTMSLPDGSEWILLSLKVEDPEYLTQPYIVNYHFTKLPDASKWNPTACSTK
jgi:hypothetical protein